MCLCMSESVNKCEETRKGGKNDMDRIIHKDNQIEIMMDREKLKKKERREDDGEKKKRKIKRLIKSMLNHMTI